jgi:hypothetical protein
MKRCNFGNPPKKNPRTSKVIKMIRRGSGVDQELMPGSTSFAKGLTGKALCSLLCQDPYTMCMAFLAMAIAQKHHLKFEGF